MASWLFCEAFLGESISVYAGFGMLVALLVKMGVEASLLLPARATQWSFAKKSALIQLNSLLPSLKLRWVGFIGASLLLCIGIWNPIYALACLPIVLVGEWIERSHFFQAVVTLKMPGEVNKTQH